MSESNATLTAAVIGAVIGGVIGICGSLVSFFVSERRKQAELENRSNKDLIAELEQNKRYQATGPFIDLEDGAYKRLRERGFFYDLSIDLQNDLQELYASIHEKNDLIAYYNRAGAASMAAESLITHRATEYDAMHARMLRGIMDVIQPKEQKIVSLIDKVLPQLRNLLKTQGNSLK